MANTCTVTEFTADGYLERKVEELSVVEFIRSYGHVKVRFDNFNKGWITYVSNPHPDTGRVFKVVTNYMDTKFHRDDLKLLSHILDEEDYGYTAWAEVYADGKLVETSNLYLSKS